MFFWQLCYYLFNALYGTGSMVKDWFEKITNRKLVMLFNGHTIFKKKIYWYK